MSAVQTSDKAREIELWFEFGSNYSYLSVMRIEDLATKYGIQVSWPPFLLGPIFQSFGWNSSPFVLQKEKGEYVQKDMARQCKKHGIPWKMPTQFPRLGVLPLRVMLVGAGQPWVGEFAKRVMLLNFYLDRDINSRDEIASILTDLGQPTAEVLAQAQSDPIKNRLRDQTETAKARKVFGAPTFFVRGEMFWGNDRLEDALEFAAGKTERGRASEGGWQRLGFDFATIGQQTSRLGDVEKLFCDLAADYGPAASDRTSADQVNVTERSCAMILYIRRFGSPLPVVHPHGDRREHGGHDRRGD